MIEESILRGVRDALLHLMAGRHISRLAVLAHVDSGLTEFVLGSPEIADLELTFLTAPGHPAPSQVQRVYELDLERARWADERFDAVLLAPEPNYWATLRVLQAVSAVEFPEIIAVLGVHGEHARRDGYPAASAVPVARQSESAEGILEGWRFAIEEGGDRNGVLTAIEDFTATSGDGAWRVTADLALNASFLIAAASRGEEPPAAAETRAGEADDELAWTRADLAASVRWRGQLIEQASDLSSRLHESQERLAAMEGELAAAAGARDAIRELLLGHPEGPSEEEPAAES